MLEQSNTELNAATDEELAALAGESEEAVAELLKRYLKLIRYYANRYSENAADADDLVQEGLMALLHVIPRYREQLGSSFSALARTSIVNRMRSIVRRVGRYASPVENIAQVMEEQAGLVEKETPESILLEKESYAQCRMQVMALLSDREWEILQCVMEGASYAQTAQRLGIAVKSVDNAMQRVRRKMRAVKSTDYFQ